jgi:hypothetical protein
MAALTCSQGYSPRCSQPAASATTQVSAISPNDQWSTVDGDASGNPQYQIEFVVRSATRPDWNLYVAHQPSGLASRNGTLISSQTPPAPPITWATLRVSRARSAHSSSGSAKKPG